MYDDDGNLTADITTRPARYLQATFVTADGERLFADDEWETVDAIAEEVFLELWTALRKHLRFDREPKQGETAKN